MFLHVLAFLETPSLLFDRPSLSGDLCDNPLFLCFWIAIRPHGSCFVDCFLEPLMEATTLTLSHFQDHYQNHLFYVDYDYFYNPCYSVYPTYNEKSSNQIMAVLEVPAPLENLNITKDIGSKFLHLPNFSPVRFRA